MQILAAALASTLSTVLPTNKLVEEIKLFETLAMVPYPDISPQNRSTGFTYKVKTCPIPQNSLLVNLNEIGDLRLGTMINSVPVVVYYAINILSRLPCFLCRLVIRRDTLSSVLFSWIPTFRDTVRLVIPEFAVEEFIGFASVIDKCGELLKRNFTIVPKCQNFMI